MSAGRITGTGATAVSGGVPQEQEQQADKEFAVWVRSKATRSLAWPWSATRRIQLRLRSVSSTEALGAERGQADSDG